MNFTDSEDYASTIEWDPSVSGAATGRRSPIVSDITSDDSVSGVGWRPMVRGSVSAAGAGRDFSRRLPVAQREDEPRLPTFHAPLGSGRPRPRQFFGDFDDSHDLPPAGGGLRHTSPGWDFSPIRTAWAADQPPHSRVNDFGPKPTDRRLSYPELPYGLTSTRGRYEPIAESRTRYGQEAARQPSMEQLMFRPAERSIRPEDHIQERDSFATRSRRRDSPPRDSGHSASRRSERERIPVLKVKDYDGKSSWTEFIRRFGAVAVANKWSYDTMGDQLKNCLVGEAGTIIHKIPESVYWGFNEVSAELSAAFGPSRDHQLLLQEKLERRRRKKGESLFSLRADIGELVEVAYPNHSLEGRRALTVDRFIRALDNPKVIHEVLKYRPRTLDEALNAARLEEANWQAACCISQGSKSDSAQRAVPAEEFVVKQEQTRVESSSAGEAMIAEMRNLTKAVSDMMASKPEVQGGRGRGQFPPRGRGVRSRGPVTCYQCGIVGHVRYNCPDNTSQGKGGKCNRCQESGHWARDCPAPVPVLPNKPPSDVPLN